MSWNYAVHQINRSFEQMAFWYRDFMHRTEQSFRALHRRLVYLEEREAWHGPSDEQVERVLKKILADKFASTDIRQPENPHARRSGDYFVERPKGDESVPKAIPIDLAALRVDATAVPSEEYRQTLKMMENELAEFPHVDLRENTQGYPQDPKNSPDRLKRPNQPSNQHQAKPWI